MVKKKPLPNKLFELFLKDSIRSFYYESYTFEKFLPKNYFLYYYPSKEQIDQIFFEIEGRQLATLKFKSDAKYVHIDLDDGFFGVTNIAALCIGMCYDEGAISQEETFEYYMRLLKVYVNGCKYALLRRWEVMDAPGNHHISATEKTTLYTNEWTDEHQYATLPQFFDKYLDNKKYHDAVEQYIESEINYFCGYDTCYITGRRSEIYLLQAWMMYFNFSDEFIQKNYKYIWVPFAFKNRYYYENRDRARFIIAKSMEANINDVIQNNSMGVKNPEIKLTEEKIDEYLLLFITNS